MFEHLRRHIQAESEKRETGFRPTSVASESKVICDVPDSALGTVIGSWMTAVVYVSKSIMKWLMAGLSSPYYVHSSSKEPMHAA